jgi:hypothetical protein
MLEALEDYVKRQKKRLAPKRGAIPDYNDPELQRSRGESLRRRANASEDDRFTEEDPDNSK